MQEEERIPKRKDEQENKYQSRHEDKKGVSNNSSNFFGGQQQIPESSLGVPTQKNKYPSDKKKEKNKYLYPPMNVYKNLSPVAQLALAERALFNEAYPVLENMLNTISSVFEDILKTVSSLVSQTDVCKLNLLTKAISKKSPEFSHLSPEVRAKAIADGYLCTLAKCINKFPEGDIKTRFLEQLSLQQKEIDKTSPEPTKETQSSTGDSSNNARRPGSGQ